jgi:hypothetical protein
MRFRWLKGAILQSDAAWGSSMKQQEQGLVGPLPVSLWSPANCLDPAFKF